MQVVIALAEMAKERDAAVKKWQDAVSSPGIVDEVKDVAELRTMCQARGAVIAERDNELRRLTTAVDELKTTCAEAKAQVNGLAKLYAEKDATQADIARHCKAVEGQLDAAHVTIAQLRSEASPMEHKLRVKKLEDMIEQLKVSHSAEVEQRRHAEKRFQEQRIAAGVLGDKLEDAHIMIATLRSELEERGEATTTLPKCVVCMDKVADVVILPCKHVCLCPTCAGTMVFKPCPMCRVPMVGCLQVYLI